MTRIKHVITSSPVASKKAINIARAALVELDEGRVGHYLSTEMTGDNVATHRFAADIPGYKGWEWIAVVACAPGSTYITVNETALVPGAKALRAPQWVPYEERLRPGDLRPGDIMPPSPDDERLATVRGHQVLSRRGKKAALSRWSEKYSSDSDFARQAHDPCATCAFYIDISDAMGAKFGVCANEYSADGRVVAADYGCGAHSLTPQPELPESSAPFDDFGY
ncbi:MAG: DUF3027 domain-containing protein [Corynebacterium sp.]|nr:DUF3027 domain-containing protein [Corynebacterium sp.]